MKHKKVKKNIHTKLKMAEYLESNNLNINQNEAKTLFQLKLKMVDVKANFPSGLNYDIDCTLCDHEG